MDLKILKIKLMTPKFSTCPCTHQYVKNKIYARNQNYQLQYKTTKYFGTESVG
jgi:hypothetical protein